MPKSHINGIFVILLLLSCLVSYANTFRAPFVFDDYNVIIKNNPKIQIEELNWTNVKTAMFYSKSNRRPLPTLTLALNYYFGGTDTFGYHLVNVSIHLLAGVFLFFFFKTTLMLSLFKKEGKGADASFQSHSNTFNWIAFLSALIWLVHPLQTNAVTYIVQRMTSLAAMFYIISIFLYAKGRISMRGRRYGLAAILLTGCLLSGLCAVISKENAATLPVLIILYEWFFFQDLRKISLKWLLAIGLIGGLIFGTLFYIFLGSSPIHVILSSYGQWGFTLPQRVLTEFRVIAFYLSLIVFPHPDRLLFDYHYPLSSSMADPLTTLISLAMVVGLVIAAVYSAKSRRLFAFCILWFLGTLSIESTVIGIEIIYEHRLYLPSMMVCLAVAYLGYRLFLLKRSTAIICLLIVVVLVGWTHQRNRVWSDDLVFWKDCAKKAPYDARPILNLAYSYQLKGNQEKAIRYYKETLKMKDHPMAAYNMGIIYSEKGYHLEAIAAYQQAIDLNYITPKTYTYLADEFLMIGVFQKALENYKRAMELNKDNPVTNRKYLRLLEFLRQCRAPQTCVKAYAQKYPENPALKFRAGVLYENSNKIKQAISKYEEVRSMISGSKRQLSWFTIHHLADCYTKTGEIDKSFALYIEGSRIWPEDYRFCYQLAALYAYKCNAEEAMKWLERSVERGFHDLDRLESDSRFSSIRHLDRYYRIKEEIRG